MYYWEGLFLLVVGFGVILFITAMNRYERVILPRSYAAWCKQTGNKKNLTYEEWRSLILIKNNTLIITDN